MSISQTNTIAKIAAVVAGLGLVAMSFASFAPAAQAQTTDVSAQIAALQAQLAALMSQTGSTGACTSFMANLTMGSKGADVSALQSWLIGKGFSIPAGATGYFGAQSKAALAAYQASAGISPAVGFFGPITRAKVNALGCTTGNGGSTGGTTTGGLTGGSGRLTNIDTLGDVESDLNEGDAATKVLGFSADAQDSDVAVQRLDVTVTIPSGTGSASTNKYFDTIAVYQDGKKIGSMAASAGDKDGRVWTYRFADLNGVIREGKTGNFYVEVTPISSIGSTEDADQLTIAIPTDGLRAVDAQGISETYTVTGASETFGVSTATTGTLTLNEGSNNPKATTVKADLNDSTEDVTLLSFNLKAKNQDVTIHNLPVVVTANAVSLSDYVQTVKLMKGSTVIKSKSATTSAASQTFLFDNIDQNVSQDSSENFTVVATVRKIDAGGTNTFASGDTLVASVSSAGAWDVEDADGNSVNPSGTLTGNTMTFQATGVTVSKVDATYSKTTGTTAGSGDNTQYSISFKVTAGDDDLYISRTITRLASTSTAVVAANGVQWATTTSSTASSTHPTFATNLSVGDTNTSGDTASVYKIPSGTTRTFTLNVTLTAANTGFTGVQLVGIGYGTTSTMSTTYTSGLDVFKTADVSMSVH